MRSYFLFSFKIEKSVTPEECNMASANITRNAGGYKFSPLG